MSQNLCFAYFYEQSFYYFSFLMSNNLKVQTHTQLTEVLIEEDQTDTEDHT